MQCMSLILRPANFGPHQHPLFLRQCLGVIMSESQEAAFAGTSAANQQYVSFSLQRSLLQLVLNVCTTVQVIGTVLGDDDDDDEVKWRIACPCSTVLGFLKPFAICVGPPCV